MIIDRSQIKIMGVSRWRIGESGFGDRAEDNQGRGQTERYFDLGGNRLADGGITLIGADAAFTIIPATTVLIGRTASRHRAGK
jgi:hypothetical protein